jgi:RNA polymerase sigma-70 factor (ECF subfamily)
MAETDDWTLWLDRHGGTLLMLARQWAPSSSDAADIVQEGFLRFWRSRQGVADPEAYLYACLKRCALDLHRGNRRRRQREFVAARDEGSGGWMSDRPERESRMKEIEQGLTQLPSAQREVMTMKVWGRLTFEQIAAALEISPHTAASRYRYALEKLRTELRSKESVR